MDRSRLIITLINRFLMAFVIVFVIHSALTFLWNLIIEGQGKFSWHTSVVIALVFGIAIPILDWSRKRR